MDIEKRLERIEREVEEIRKYVNDISHAIGRVEEGMEWIKMAIRILFGVIGIVLGLVITTI